MSIAEEEKQINEIITNSKQRLRVVDEKIQELNNEKLSIDEDISILTQRLDVHVSPRRSSETASRARKTPTKASPP